MVVFVGLLDLKFNGNYNQFKYIVRVIQLLKTTIHTVIHALNSLGQTAFYFYDIFASSIVLIKMYLKT
jgi:hypothetical protein